MDATTAAAMGWLERLQVEQACRRLSLEFARLNDAGRYEELAALFTPEGVLSRPLAPDVDLRGRDAILQDIRRKPPGAMSHHVCSNVLVDVLSNEEAVGSTYFTVYLQLGGATPHEPFQFEGTVYVGTYVDRFRRTAEGWRIAERRGVNRFFLAAPLSA